MTPAFSNPLVTLYQGDVMEVLAQLPAESVHCIVTSPPYWGLRQYSGEQERVWDAAEGCQHEWGKEHRSSRGHAGNRSTLAGTQTARLSKAAGGQGSFCVRCPAWRGCLGQEPTVEMYIAHIMQVMAALWRVLRDDGACWVNLDDTRLGSGSPGGDYRDGRGGDEYLRPYNRTGKGMRPKDMALVPERFILAAQAQGWYVRSKVVWALTNSMPESCTDRATDAYQMVYQLVKSERYWWDQEAVREEGSDNSHGGGGMDMTRKQQTVGGGHAGLAVSKPAGDGGRNARNVQTWPTEGLGSFRVNGKTLTHFAAFPRALPLWAIRASCPATCCGRCGAGYMRVVERKPMEVRHSARHGDMLEQGLRTAINGTMVSPPATRTLGWAPTCQCSQDIPTTPGLILDPFLGSGTTALAAQELGRRCIGIDLSADYIALAQHRLERQQPAMAGMEV